MLRWRWISSWRCAGSWDEIDSTLMPLVTEKANSTYEEIFLRSDGGRPWKRANSLISFIFLW